MRVTCIIPESTFFQFLCKNTSDCIQRISRKAVVSLNGFYVHNKLRLVETYLQNCLPKDTGLSLQFSQRNCLKKINQRWGRDEKLTLDISITKNGGNSDYTLSFCQSSIGDWFYLSPDLGSQQNFIQMIKDHGLKRHIDNNLTYTTPEDGIDSSVNIDTLQSGLSCFLKDQHVKIYCDMDETLCRQNIDGSYLYFEHMINLVKSVSRSTEQPIHIVTAAEAPIHMRNVMTIFNPSNIASVTSAEGLVEVEKVYLKFVQPDKTVAISVIFDDRPDVWRIPTEHPFILIQPCEDNKLRITSSDDIIFDSTTGQLGLRKDQTGSTAYSETVSRQESKRS